MADQVKQVKQKADIVSVIGERVKLKKAGRNFQALCPFHSEKTPSFNVSPELQIYKCFGCGESGDVFEFLEKFEGMEFPEALRYVADKVGVKIKQFRSSGEYGARENLLAILSLTQEFYHYLLTNHAVGERARKYLKARGIWKRTIETFKLGYSPESWDSLQKYLVGKKGYKKDDIEKVGLLVRRSTRGYYDRFRGRVMFPLTNQRGQVLGFAGRLFDSSTKGVAERGAKYVNSPETPLYHKSDLLYGLALTKRDIKKEDRAIVVEGELDMLSSWQVGVKNVVAIKGSALTEDQIKLLGRYTKNISLALDADSAGDEATKRGITLADKLGMNVRVVELAGGKDPDELAQGDREKWKRAVRRAVSVYDFYLKSALKRWNRKTGEGKRKISRELTPVFAGIVSSVEQAHYIGKLAKALGVSEEVVGSEVERAGRGVEREQGEEKEQKVEEEGSVLDEYVLGLVLKSGGKLFDRVDSIKKQWFRVAAAKRTFEALKGEESRKFLKEGEWDIGGFVDSLPEELKALVQRLWLESYGTESRGVGEREFNRAAHDLRQRYVRGRLKRLAERIGELEQNKKLNRKEEKKFERLQSQFVKISLELGK